MAGRRSHHERSAGGSRAQAPKQPRGFARGHGAHHRHRPGREAPHPFGSGRDRTDEERRAPDFKRLSDEQVEGLVGVEKRADAERWVDQLVDARAFGALLEGVPARGVVVEVRRGNFLTRMLSSSPPVTGEGEAERARDGLSPRPAVWQPSDLLRTFVRGTLQHFDLGLSSLVAPGDDVELIVPPLEGERELVQHGQHAVLTRALPRRSSLRRLHPSGRAVQTIAANVDRVCIVASAGEPQFRPGFVDRVLVCASASDLPAILIYNKTDLGVPPADEELLQVYRSLGIEVFRVSVADPDSPQGDFAALKDRLAGTRSVLAGHSGVGKSSLLLAFDKSLDTDVVPVSYVSEHTGKGVHTTTHARLFLADFGDGRSAEIVDTPGLREFTPADADRRNLWGWFPELARLQGQCAFADCTHVHEQDCAVLAAVARGEIHPRRHQSYVRIYQTLPG